MKRTNIRKKKNLDKRCPVCDSSQIYERTLLGNWKCQNCDEVFTIPKKDDVTV
jgi:ribosomal protein L37AE/L43A